MFSKKDFALVSILRFISRTNSCSAELSMKNKSLGAISPLFHNIFYMLLEIFIFRQGPDFHFEISGYSR